MPSSPRSFYPAKAADTRPRLQARERGKERDKEGDTKGCRNDERLRRNTTAGTSILKTKTQKEQKIGTGKRSRMGRTAETTNRKGGRGSEKERERKGRRGGADKRAGKESEKQIEVDRKENRTRTASR